MRPQFDFLLQVGVGVLQSTRHVVELIGERLQLVAGFDRDALREIAAADPGSAGPQGLDRHNHPSREEYARESREEKRADEDQGGADRKSTRLNSSHVKISYAVF